MMQRLTFFVHLRGAETVTSSSLAGLISRRELRKLGIAIRTVTLFVKQQKSTGLMSRALSDSLTDSNLTV